MDHFTVEHLSISFGGLKAVNDVSFNVEKNTIFSFIGPNGAGKTTTIRMMGGTLSPTAGAVVIDGIDMAARPEEAKRRIGFIPDRPFLYEKLTGMEFMRFSADLYGVGDGTFRPKAEDLLRTFGLFDWSHDLIEAYSHGMKQRLVISAALLHDPRVLVVDEPMVGLDPAAIKMVKDILKDLARRGTAVFMSTHTLSVAEDLCDRIGIIHRGALIALGTTRELKRLAQAQQADLEEVFLKLTEEQALS